MSITHYFIGTRCAYFDAYGEIAASKMNKVLPNAANDNPFDMEKIAALKAA